MDEIGVSPGISEPPGALEEGIIENVSFSDLDSS